MFICNHCGETFEDPITSREHYGFNDSWGEDIESSPCCESGFEVAVECKVCKKIVGESKIDCEICESCQSQIENKYKKFLLDNITEESEEFFFDNVQKWDFEFQEK